METTTTKKLVGERDFDIVYRNGQMVKPDDPESTIDRMSDADVSAFHQLSNAIDIVDDSLVHMLSRERVCFKIRETLRNTGYSSRIISDRGLTVKSFAATMPATLVDRITLRPNEDQSDIMVGFVTPVTKDQYEIYEEPLYVPAGHINETSQSEGDLPEFLANQVPDRKLNGEFIHNGIKFTNTKKPYHTPISNGDRKEND